MYGFSGYGTNTYGSERPTGSIGPLVKLAMRTAQNGYNAVIALMLRFRNVTASDPESTQQTLEL